MGDVLTLWTKNILSPKFRIWRDEVYDGGISVGQTLSFVLVIIWMYAMEDVLMNTMDKLSFIKGKSHIFDWVRLNGCGHWAVYEKDFQFTKDRLMEAL